MTRESVVVKKRTDSRVSLLLHEVDSNRKTLLDQENETISLILGKRHTKKPTNFKECRQNLLQFQTVAFSESNVWEKSATFWEIVEITMSPDK